MKPPLTANKINRPMVTHVSIKVCLSNQAWYEWDGRWGIGHIYKDYIDVAKIAEVHEQIADKLIEEVVL